MHSSKASRKQSPKKKLPKEKDLKDSGELSKSLEVLHLSESTISVSQKLSTSTLEVFRVMYYMKHFRATDMNIKLVDRTVIIDARHDEHVDEHGFVSRFFVKTVNLPANVNEEELVVTFNADGILSLFAPLHDIEEDPGKDSGVGEDSGVESKSKEDSESRDDTEPKSDSESKDDTEPKSDSESKDSSESKCDPEIKIGSDSRDDGDTNTSDMVDEGASRSGSDSNVSLIRKTVNLALENKEAV